MKDEKGRPGTVLEGSLHPTLCVPGHPDAVPVRFDYAVLSVVDDESRAVVHGEINEELRLSDTSAER